MTAYLPAPHGGELITLGIEAAKEYDHVIDLEMTPKTRADLEMIAIGAYSPLRTFVDEENYHSILEHSHLSTGELWPIPITLAVTEQPPVGTEAIRLLREGVHAATLELTEVFPLDIEREATVVYGTTDPAHPGVASLIKSGKFALTGRLLIHADPRNYLGSEYFTPTQTRALFEAKGWKTVVAFQTRNPVHRAHEYLHKVALELIDGLFLNPLVGETKSDDVPADVRMDAYRALLEHYYPSDRVLLGVYPAAMRYAGPKEAILHAISRKNYGCTHFIVGRDHAGVGSYYGTYAAQEIFDTIDEKELGISILRFEHSFFCRRCEQVVSTRTCPHPATDHVVLSGTKVREMLSAGASLPAEFSRPEVAAVLMRAYATKDAPTA